MLVVAVEVCLNSCATAPITERKQLKIIPEAKLNAQAAQIYEKVKEKEKLSKDTKTLNLIKEIEKSMEDLLVSIFTLQNKMILPQILIGNIFL